MKIFNLKKSLNIFTDLKFALFLLLIIAILSSLGSFIEQDQPITFYIENYPISRPIYGFIDSNLIINLGIDHVYQTWWFLLLLFSLGISLISCTITRQFPLVINSKEFFFKQKKNSYKNLPFFVRIKNIYYLKETILLRIQKLNFYIYQKNELIYGYKGLLGRISPILVHMSLIIILLGAGFGAFKNFKAQELLPKGEVFHIQNPIGVGWFTKIPNLTIRVNDFWVEYEKNKIHQFYSTLSILDNYGNEIKNKTVSVNNPLKHKGIDFYQSDWNLLGIRVKNIKNDKILEYPVFQLNENSKTWITWIESKKETYSLIFDQLENTFLVYDSKGNFFENGNIQEKLKNESTIIEILPATGLLIKYDPSIKLIYFGFGLLMLTTVLSYLPYTQLWIFNNSKNTWVGGATNRGKIQLEIEFENLVRYIEKITK